MPKRVFIGTAGWSIPRAVSERFPGEGTHLERYGRIFRCAEINSSFHRPHSATTYAKWASATPRAFRFAIKLPRTITHDQKLRRTRSLLDEFLDQMRGLGSRRGPLLVQLPPSLAFEPAVVRTFFRLLRERWDGAVVCEPRHETWFTSAAETMLARFEAARVAADPMPAPGAELPGGWPGIIYYRLHGSPRKYWSSYEPEYIAALAARIRSAPPSVDVWCVFDNTASGSAAANAWNLQDLLQGRSPDQPAGLR